MNPRNISGDPKGFNSGMFKGERSIRRAFIILGYKTNPKSLTVPDSSVKKFQMDYNSAATRIVGIGSLEINGKINNNTLNALEFAIRWSKKQSSIKGTTISESWSTLCQSGPGRVYSNIKHEETNFVEVLKDGTGKLRSTRTDNCLRCNVLEFERHGDTIFAVVSVPPQGDLPEGCKVNIVCPCVFLNDDHGVN